MIISDYLFDCFLIFVKILLTVMIVTVAFSYYFALYATKKIQQGLDLAFKLSIDLEH